MTENLEIRSASSLGLGARAELFNASYEGYLIPMHVDETTVAFMVEVFDLDVDASRIAVWDGIPVGIGNLGLRGADAWIGGIGVVPSARRRGIGEALMGELHEQALEHGVRRVWLEVIVENAGAFALYEKLGYRIVRDVEVWSLAHSVAKGTEAESASAAEAHARIRDLRTDREPWQRADETLAHYSDARGLVSGTGAAVFRQAGENVQLVQLAGDAEPLLRALRALGPVMVLNLPADAPAADVLRELGGSVVVRQHEMLLELS